MTSTAKKILEDALALPEADRLHVAELLMDSLSPEPKAEIEREWTEEAIWRANEAERGDVPSLNGNQVIADLEAELRNLHEQ